MKLFSNRTVIFFITFSFYFSACSQVTPFNANISDSTLSSGYYFLHTYKVRKELNPTPCQQLILDAQGQVLYCRKTKTAGDFNLQPDGRISYYANGKHYLMDSLFKIVDSVSCVNGIETDSHDFLILPNGHFLLIGMKITPMDLGAYKMFMKKELAGSKNGKLKADVIQELDENHKLVFQWNAADFYKVTDCDPLFLTDSMSVSLPHINSLAMDANGNIVASCRNTNEIIKINHTTGKIIWKFGGAHNQFRLLNDSLPFYGQHDARYLPNGNLMLFDNGYAVGNKQHGARAVEYKIDERNYSATKVWDYTYDASMTSEAGGSARRMSNGTTLINYAKILNNSKNVLAVLVDKNGKKVFELSFADSLASYRCYRYDRLPFTIARPVIHATKTVEGILLHTSGGVKSGNWSTGEKQVEMILVTKPGSYILNLPYGDGGFIYSEPFIVTQDMLSGK